MFTKELKVLIKERSNAPETKLFVKIVAADEESLKTKPYVFMLPGGPGANHSHYKDYSCLTDVANIVFHDPRGCGLSDRGEESTYNMENYIEDMECLRQHLELAKISLLGKSYGAMCALGYTLRFPEAIDKLIMAAGSPSFRNLETAKEHVQARGTEEQKAVCEKLFAGSFNSNEEAEHYFDVMDGFYSYKVRHDQPTNRPLADYPFEYQPLNQGFGGFLRHFDYEDRLAEVKAPTLILVGEEDWITDQCHSKRMSTAIPNNKILVFSESDHAMEADVPELFFGKIRNFISHKFDYKKGFFSSKSVEASSEPPTNNEGLTTEKYGY